MKKLLLIIAMLSVVVNAQNFINYVTYGPDASVVEGDDDFKQIFTLSIDSGIDTTLFIKMFDSNCTGNYDLVVGAADTKLSFRVFADYYQNENLPNSSFKNKIFERIIEPESELDGIWETIFEIHSSKGKIIGEKSFFILEIEGISGNDANVYNLIVNANKNSIISESFISLTNAKPAIRLQQNESYASLRFIIPKNSKTLTLYDYDLAGAELYFNSFYRSKRLSKVSGQGEWNSNIIPIDESEKGTTVELVLGKGGEIPNDATFYILDDSQEIIQMNVPNYSVKLNKTPIVKYDVAYLSDCYSVVLDAEDSYDTDGNILFYKWVINSDTLYGSKIVYDFTEKGVFPVTLFIQDDSEGVYNTVKSEINVNVNLEPNASFNAPLLIAPEEEILFDASSSSDKDGSIIQYSWNFGDGTNSDKKVIIKKYKYPGKYKISLRVQDDSESPCNFDISEKYVNVNYPPTAIANQDIIAAIDEKINLSAENSFDEDGEIISYVWKLNGTTVIGNGKQFDYKFDKSGVYTIELTVNDNSGKNNSSSRDNVTVFINQPPIAIANKEMLIAENEVFTLDAEGSTDLDGYITKYNWDFGDGNTSEGFKVSHSYKNAGIYKVVLKVFDNLNLSNSMSSAEISIRVNDSPEANAGSDVYTTFPIVKFDGSNSTDKDGNITEYKWILGDGNVKIGKNIEHSYTKPGEYIVELIVKDNTDALNNISKSVKKVKINAMPIALAGKNILVSPGEVFQLDGSKSNDSDGFISDFLWDMGDGNTLRGEKVNYSYKSSGVYNVLLKVSDNSGDPEAIDYSSLMVFVNHSPIAVAGLDIISEPEKEIILDGGKSFDPDNGNLKYNWEIPDKGFKAEKSIVSVKFDKPGIYNAILEVRDDEDVSNSESSDTITIFINSNPIAYAGEDIITCETSVEFDASKSADADGDLLEYIWDFGDNTPIKQGSRVKHTFPKRGIFPVTLIVNDLKGLTNSKNSHTISVRINQPPVADAGGNFTICAGEVSIFNGSNSYDPEGGVLNYEWDFGDGTTEKGVNPTKRYLKGGIYKVALTVIDETSLNCNKNTDYIYVNVVESPVANAGKDTIICANSEIIFDGSKSTDFDGVVNSFSWNFGDGETALGVKPSHSYKIPGEYQVSLTITGDKNGNCDNSDTDFITVKVVEAPEAKFTAVKSAPINTPVIFDATQSLGAGFSITEYIWDFGNGNTAEGVVVEQIFKEFGRYSVKLKIRTDSETECNFSESIETIVINNPPIADAGKDIFIGIGEYFNLSAFNSIDTDGEITKYQWIFPSGEITEQGYTEAKFDKFGEYPIILKVFDNSALDNNFGMDTVLVKVNSSPIAKVVSRSSVCADEMVDFSVSESNDPDGYITEYKWLFEDGSEFVGERVSKKLSKTGNYNVKLILTDNSGMESGISIINHMVKVNSSPNFKLKRKRYTICPNETLSIKLIEAFDQELDNVSVSWELPDKSKLLNKDLIVSFSQPGEYKIKVLADDLKNTECSLFEDEIFIKVNTIPVPVISSDNETFIGSSNDFIILSAENSYDAVGDILNYYWDLGDGTIKVGKIVKHQFEKPGTYKVILNISDGNDLECGSASIEKIIKVIERK